MASSESLKLLLGSDCSVKVDSFPFDWLLVFDRVVDVKVKIRLLDEGLFLEDRLVFLKFDLDKSKVLLDGF